jgi:hypothetical protein
MTSEAIFGGVSDRDEVETRWFCGNGAVRERKDGVFEVTVGGILVGTYTRREPERRNLLLVGLASNPQVPIGELAWAFRMTTERLRQIRKIASEQGVEALMVGDRRGKKPVSEHMKKRIAALFDAGLSIDQAYAKVKRSVSRATVGRVHKEWIARGAGDAPKEDRSPEQQHFGFGASDEMVVVRSAKPPRSRDTKSRIIVPPAPPPGTFSLEDGVELTGRHVQHVGAWVMLGELHARGLYDSANRFRCDDLAAEDLRAALDAAAISLTIGQRCMEGVRRLATPSAPTLLRTRRKPSANWTRERLHEFADQGAVLLHLDETRRHALALAAEKPGRLVFYVDNHLRPYTGKHVIRKGWRMQDKRVVPGCTDYYVHDAEGRPVMRMDKPKHEPLVDVVQPIGRFLREQLGYDVPLLFVFDRAGAFPEHMTMLRDDDLEFVTYERKPYPALPNTAFKSSLIYRKQTIRWVERRQKNLAGGRGRVRRISLLTSEGSQINVLAVSTAPAPELILALLHRWSHQENQLKHEKERWGINQLDGRRVEPYPEDDVIPNPARRRLDLDVRDARLAEAEALRELAHLLPDHRRRAQLEQTASEAYARQCELQARRPGVPKRAPLRDTELTGRLRLHPGRYKLVIDTLRVALANVEAELADDLAPHLRKPREAKKTLANLLAAPGHIRIGQRSIKVALEPAGTARELRAFVALLRATNARRLTLPGDLTRRPLRFSIAKS